MNANEEIAPAVRSILAAARERGDREEATRTDDREGPDRPDERDGPIGSDDRLTVDAQSLPAALAGAEADGRIPIVAEVKPTSPTTEGHRTDDPVALARRMVEGGAAALSVLTEPEHFGGSPEDLRRVREAVEVPVVRKDFLLSEGQLDVVEADAVLLIARFLEDLPGMVRAARERGFQPLVEVHTVEELARAVDAGADLVGVNNRDLARLSVDLNTFERLAPEAPDTVTLIAESGIATGEDAVRMRRAGADGLLVGSAIMDGDVTENTRRLTGASTRHDR